MALKLLAMKKGARGENEKARLQAKEKGKAREVDGNKDLMDAQSLMEQPVIGRHRGTRRPGTTTSARFSSTTHHATNASGVPCACWTATSAVGTSQIGITVGDKEGNSTSNGLFGKNDEGLGGGPGSPRSAGSCHSCLIHQAPSPRSYQPCTFSGNPPLAHMALYSELDTGADTMRVNCQRGYEEPNFVVVSPKNSHPKGGDQPRDGVGHGSWPWNSKKRASKGDAARIFSFKFPRVWSKTKASANVAVTRRSEPQTRSEFEAGRLRGYNSKSTRQNPRTTSFKQSRSTALGPHTIKPEDYPVPFSILTWTTHIRTRVGRRLSSLSPFLPSPARSTARVPIETRLPTPVPASVPGAGSRNILIPGLHRPRQSYNKRNKLAHLFSSMVVSPLWSSSHSNPANQRHDDLKLIQSTVPRANGGAAAVMKNWDEFEVYPSTTGFFPPYRPLDRLPDEWAPWEDVLAEAVETKLKLYGGCERGEAWREKVRKLPVLSTKSLEKLSPLLRRAHHVLAWIMHFYIHSLPLPPTPAEVEPGSDKQPPQVEPVLIPKSISIPLLTVSKILVQPPVVSYSDQTLYNWTYVHPPVTMPRNRARGASFPSPYLFSSPSPPASPPLWPLTVGTNADKLLPELNNVKCQTLFTSTSDEEEFYLASTRIELRGVEALSLMWVIVGEVQVAEKAARVWREKTKANEEKEGKRGEEDLDLGRYGCALQRIAMHLSRLAMVIRDMEALLRALREKCDPEIYYHQVRPWLKGEEKEVRPWLFEGVDVGVDGGEKEMLELQKEFEKVRKDMFGPTAGQSALIHALDEFLGVENHPKLAKLGLSSKESLPGEVSGAIVDGGVDHSGGEKDPETESIAVPTTPSPAPLLTRMRNYMPRAHRAFLEYLATLTVPLRAVVLDSFPESNGEAGVGWEKVRLPSPSLLSSTPSTSSFASSFSTSYSPLPDTSPQESSPPSSSNVPPQPAESNGEGRNGAWSAGANEVLPTTANAASTATAHYHTSVRAAYNETLRALKGFRDTHLRMVVIYIVGPARRAREASAPSPFYSGVSTQAQPDAHVNGKGPSDDVAVSDGSEKRGAAVVAGTGGSDLMPFLKGIRDRTSRAEA